MCRVECRGARAGLQYSRRLASRTRICRVRWMEPSTAVIRWYKAVYCHVHVEAPVVAMNGGVLLAMFLVYTILNPTT